MLYVGIWSHSFAGLVFLIYDVLPVHELIFVTVFLCLFIANINYNFSTLTPNSGWLVNLLRLIKFCAKP